MRLSERYSKLSTPARVAVVTAGVILVLCLLVAVTVDPLATWFLNKQLHEAPGMDGQVKAVHVGLLTGTASVTDLQIQQVSDAGAALPIFDLVSADIGIDRGALLRGVVKVSVEAEAPHVTLYRSTIEGPEGEKIREAATPPPNLQATLRNLLPINIDSLKVQRGIMRYKDPDSKPPVDVRVRDIALTATNLSNRTHVDESLFAKVHLTAVPLEEGSFTLDLKADPMQKVPTFEMQTELKDLPMTRLNDLLRAYTKFEVSGGQAFMFAEYAARDGSFEGYVKPMLKHLDVHAWENKAEVSALARFWRNAVGLAVDLFKNIRHDQVATKVPMKGKFEDPNIGIWSAVGTLLKNGYISALMPQLDYGVSMGKVVD